MHNQTAVDALNFAKLLPPDCLKEMHMSSAEDGEVMFSCKKSSRYIEIAFYGDGYIHWFTSGPNVKVTGYEKYSKNMPTQLKIDLDIVFEKGT